MPFIRRANRSIDLFLFVFTHADLAQELVEAVARGCVVRVYLDKGLAKSDASREVIQVLVDGGVQVRFRRNTTGFMHRKHGIYDCSIVQLGKLLPFAHNDSFCLVNINYCLCSLFLGTACFSHNAFEHSEEDILFLTGEPIGKSKFVGF